MDLYLITSVAGAVAVVLLALILFLFKRIGALQELNERLQQNIAVLSQQQQTQNDGLEELRSGSIGVGKRVKSLEMSLLEQADRMQQLAEMDSDSKVYAAAIRMVKSGADVEAVIQECDLPRVEVEMLINMHTNNSEADL